MKFIKWLDNKLSDQSPTIRKLSGILLLIVIIIYIFNNPDSNILTPLLITDGALLGVGNITDIWKKTK